MNSGRVLQIDQERSMPELLLCCPLQHENARKTREEYVKLQQDITRALLRLTVWPPLHEAVYCASCLL